MKSTNDYLKKHYRTKEQLAAACSIAPQELDELIREGLIPHPSYVVTADGRLLSPAFGELPAHDAEVGEYFHSASPIWVARALEVMERVDAGEAQHEMKARFGGHFQEALLELNRTVFRLADCIDHRGEVIVDGMSRRCDAAWSAFLKGIYGLCVADPSTERGIARKEILQEALTTLSENGTRSDYSDGERAVVRTLMEAYAVASMPFTPQEYPRSSRRRLIEELAAKMEGASPHLVAGE